MKKLQNEIDQVIATCKCRKIEGGYSLPASEIQAHYASSKGAEWIKNYNQYSGMRVWLGPQLTIKLSELLFEELGDFVDMKNKQLYPINGEIGLGYRYLIADISETSKTRVDNFKLIQLAEDVVDASIMHGSECIIKLLEKWKEPESEPLLFNIKGKILGIHVTETTNIIDGVKLIPSGNGNNLVDQEIAFENILSNSLVRPDFENRSTLVVECNGPPALYSAAKKSEFIDKFKKLQSINIDYIKICEMLSLASEKHVMPILTWFDLGFELLAFPISNQFSFLMDESISNESVELTNEMLEKTKLYISGRDNIANDHPKQAVALDISIRKWIASKRSNMNFSINDRYVDMRTALEGLFLSKENGIKDLGSAVQISILCSCLLDDNPSKESESYLTLKLFYGLSSGIVHASLGVGKKLKNIFNLLSNFEHLDPNVIKNNEDFLKKEIAYLIKSKLLERAQFFYSKAIDKILKDGEIPNWKEMVQSQIESGNFAEISQQ